MNRAEENNITLPCGEAEAKKNNIDKQKMARNAILELVAILVLPQHPTPINDVSVSCTQISTLEDN